MRAATWDQVIVRPGRRPVPAREQNRRIVRDALRWGGSGVAVAVVVEIVARWLLPNHLAGPVGLIITGVMLIWLGMVVGISMARRNQASSAAVRHVAPVTAGPSPGAVGNAPPHLVDTERVARPAVSRTPGTVSASPSGVSSARPIAEDRYTLDEARRVLQRRLCVVDGHDIDILFCLGEPLGLRCNRCGRPWAVTAEGDGQ